MKIFTYFLTALLLTCSSGYSLFYAKGGDVAKFNHRITGNYPYDGDEKGAFAGDTVAILDDGSHWKVHPKNTKEFLAWQNGDEVHVEKRTSWYLFKREHKFALVNHRNNEKVFAMIIASPHYIDVIYPPLPHQWVYNFGVKSPSRMMKNLILNDGSKWQVEVDLDYKTIKNNKEFEDLYYHLDSPAYVGYNDENGKIYFFVIEGLNKQAKWRWGRPGNYFYEID